MVLALATIALVPSAVSAQEPTAEDEAEVVLRRARFDLRPLSPSRAEVSAAYELAGHGSLELLLAWFEGQQLEVSAIRLGGEEISAEAEAVRSVAVERLLLPLGTSPSGSDHSLYMTYTVQVPEDRAFRFPIPVPRTRPHPEGPEVAVSVELPAGARYGGDSFPGFSELEEVGGEQRLRARLAGVPAFVHVVFGPEASVWPIPRRLQAGALALALLPFVVFALRRRRRGGSP